MRRATEKKNNTAEGIAPPFFVKEKGLQMLKDVVQYKCSNILILWRFLK